ncbi:MAG: glycosyltransferase 1 protein [Rhodospirillales bacterium]|nr:glycosyltransferase 1 protein [Rhodospirillales bacterium]
MIKTLTFTTLFPNSVQPINGIFVANRLAHLLASGEVTTRIVAPVPWFPSKSARFGTYAEFAAVPRIERRFGCPVLHPRYLQIPRIGMVPAPALLYAGAQLAVAEMLRDGFDFDLIDAHYFYPDGVAAILLGRVFGKPVVITARGSDINQIADFRLPRQMILWAAGEAAGVVTVCQALKDRLCELGAAPDHITVLRNGVDLALFRPQDRDALRLRHGLTGKVAVSVGHLIARKGHDLAIRAVAEMPEVTLLIAGEGPERGALGILAASLGLAARVRFLGRLAPPQLAEIYAAVDLLVLASAREGWANVLLEAMACGTPVVASDVWGTPEVVAERAAGLLVRSRTGPAFAAAMTELLADPPDRAATRAYAERFSWDDTTAGQLALFRSIVRPAAGAEVG